MKGQEKSPKGVFKGSLGAKKITVRPVSQKPTRTAKPSKGKSLGVNSMASRPSPKTTQGKK